MKSCTDKRQKTSKLKKNFLTTLATNVQHSGKKGYKPINCKQHRFYMQNVNVYQIVILTVSMGHTAHDHINIGYMCA